MAQFGYTDEELCAWRKPFDELVTQHGSDDQAFEVFVIRKYGGSLPEQKLKETLKSFWQKFDRDVNNHMNFGEFIAASFLLDVVWARERIRQFGVEDTFRKYSVEEFMTESHLFQLLCDFGLAVTTATDVGELMQVADQDRDGLLSLSDFMQWASSEDDGFKDLNKARKGKRRTSPLRSTPPPIPDDDDDE